MAQPYARERAGGGGVRLCGCVRGALRGGSPAPGAAPRPGRRTAIVGQRRAKFAAAAGEATE